MNLSKSEGFSTLIIFILAAALMSASQSVVTTGLTDIMKDFAINSTTAQWVYSAFLLVLGVMIPTSAYITKRFTVKTILSSSLLLFIIGCFVAYFAPNIFVLVIARVIQAIGCGILLPVTQIVLFKVIPKEKWQIFMGLFGLIIGIAPALAPTLGGIIIDSLSWRAIFIVFAIITIVILAAGIIVANINFETEEYPLDGFSLFLCVVACVGIMLGFTNIAQFGSDFLYVILPIIVGVVALFFFVKRQLKIKKPLLNLKPLKNKYFVFGTLFSAILYFTMCGINVMIPLFVQSVAYHTATEAGIVLLPGTIIMIIFNFVGPVLATRIGVRKVLILSCIFTFVGFISMMTYNIQTDITYMIVTQVIRCIGAGLGLMPCVTWTISVVSNDVEDATAINNTIRQIIGSIGAAMAVVFMAILAGGNVAHNMISVSAFSSTSLIMAILTLISLAIVILYIKSKEDGVGE
ncbi:MAG: MFS transporter [Methanobrevibacter sp.]|uniref:MFS transporter n=1 Tax=Methanobrevibacter sp. TaxID=66852 RepID=UPI0026E0AA84|nr:MFS transporter [Methanobrevibacter sp.]MDO5849425.1 MFS transporter [Methanobrevibacter sp.]